MFNEKTIRETRQMVVDQMIGNIIIPDNSFILEPSAGSGNLAKGILAKNFTANIDCIELNKEKRELLKKNGFNVIGSDFFGTIIEAKYDFVIAAPPFKNNIDLLHIERMYECLKPGGTIISLTFPAWVMQNLPHHKRFRKWLEDKEYTICMLKDFSFVEKNEKRRSH